MRFLTGNLSFSGCAPRREYWQASAISLVLPVILFVLLTMMLFVLSTQLHGNSLEVMLSASNELNNELSPEQKEIFGEILGIDLPFYRQYLVWTRIAFLDGYFREWMTTGKPIPLLGKSESDFPDYSNTGALNASLVAQYLLLGVWLAVALALLVFWSAAIVRRLHDVGTSAWFLLAFLIPGFNLLVWLILGVQRGNSRSRYRLVAGEAS